MLRVGLRGRRCSLGDRAGFDDGAGRSPVVRQQLCQIAILQRGQALEDVFEVGPRIVPVELGRFEPMDVDAYFVTVGTQRWSRISAGHIAKMLRVFLRHAASIGACSATLADSIPQGTGSTPWSSCRTR